MGELLLGSWQRRLSLGNALSGLLLIADAEDARRSGPGAGTVSRIVEITLLTQPHCTFCEVAKEILGRLGRESPLQVRQVDLASPEGLSLAVTVGALFAPGVLIDGEAFATAASPSASCAGHSTDEWTPSRAEIGDLDV